MSELPEHAACYRAVQARDARFDGVFFTGVKSTGIYCRPVCSAKTPAAASCVFYSSAAAAEEAGFRPCLRCRPERAPFAWRQTLAHALWRQICAGALNQDDLEGLAARAGLSSRQVRRILQEEFGVSPVALAQTARLLLAKQLLTETGLPLAQVALAAGFGSVRRFNALFAERYQLTPGALRRSGAAQNDGAAGMLRLRLSYRAPFDWARMQPYLAARTLGGVEQVLPQAWRRSVLLEGHAGFIQAQPLEQELELQLTSSLLPVLQQLIARVREQFDLDANPPAIVADLGRDTLLAPHLWPGLRLPGGFCRFELAMRALLGQQVSVAAATTLTRRLIARYGQAQTLPCPWPEEQAAFSHHFPAPQALAALPAAELAQIGIPQARGQALLSLAQFAADGGLRRVYASLEEAVAALQDLRGIGPWSAHYIAMRALRFPDGFPATDLVLLNRFVQLRQLQDLSKSAQLKALEAHAQAWRPWRAYATFALWGADLSQGAQQ
ncbi:AlkA N-terminal domain-containing protein [Massilia sp. W12]|uniref:AlkA N-terminal domain-containing protein n=1 Tax=Massilia sp. W12 TaxID=3126507 RepID=UPI0030CD8A98